MNGEALVFADTTPSLGRAFVILCGSCAAGAAALFVCEPKVLALLFVVPVFALSFVECEWFLLLVVFLVPVGWSLRSGGLLHDIPGALRGVTLFGFFAGRFVRGSLTLKHHLQSPIAKFSLVFVAVAFTSVIVGSGGWTYSSGHSLYRLVSYVGFFFFICEWVNSRDKLEKTIRVLLSSTVVTALFAVLQQAANGYTSVWLYMNPPTEGFIEWERRSTSFLNYPNSLAGYLNLVLPLALALAVIGNRKWKRLARWTLALGVLALVSTQSIGGLGATVFITCMAMFRFIGSWRKRILLFACLGLALMAFYVSREILNPSHTAGSVGPDAAIRFVLWNTAWNFFVKSPTTGIGWGNFVALYGTYTSAFAEWIPAGIFEVHNIYLQLLAETGVSGLITFLYLNYISWKYANSLRLSQNSVDMALAFGIQGAIASIFVHGFVDFLFQISSQFGTLFWALLGLTVAVKQLGTRFSSSII